MWSQDDIQNVAVFGKVDQRAREAEYLLLLIASLITKHLTTDLINHQLKMVM